MRNPFSTIILRFGKGLLRDRPRTSSLRLHAFGASRLSWRASTTPRSHSLSLLILLATLLASCDVFSNPTPLAWARTPSPGVSPTLPSPPTRLPTQPLPTLPGISPTPRPAPTETTTPAPGELRLVYLKSNGALLGFTRPDGLPDPALPLPQPLSFLSDLQAGASPTGDWLVLRTGQPGQPDYNLTLLHLPDGVSRTLSPLLSPELQAQLRANPNAPAEFLTAVTLPGSLAWSPDGRYLAFTAAIHGPSSDLYLYEPSIDKLRRMTAGLYQAAAPIWSPDSLWVLTQEVLGFNINNGWKINKVWAVAVDHNEIRNLYNPPANSIGEILLGWTSSNIMLVYTQAPDGIKDIREIPLSTRWTGRLYAGPVDEAAFDPLTRTLLIYESDQTGKQLGLGAGLYRLSGPKAAPKYVQAGKFQDLHWFPQVKLFFARGMAGLIAVTPAGLTTLLKGEAHLQPSPDGLWLVCWGQASDPRPGLRLYQPDGTMMQSVTDLPVDQVLWRPDSKSIFFTSGGDLYRASYPLFHATLLDSGLVPASLAWTGK